MSDFFKIDSRLLEIAEKAEADCQKPFASSSIGKSNNTDAVTRQVKA